MKLENLNEIMHIKNCLDAMFEKVEKVNITFKGGKNVVVRTKDGLVHDHDVQTFTYNLKVHFTNRLHELGVHDVEDYLKTKGRKLHPS